LTPGAGGSDREATWCVIVILYGVVTESVIYFETVSFLVCEYILVAKITYTTSIKSFGLAEHYMCI